MNHRAAGEIDRPGLEYEAISFGDTVSVYAICA